MITYVYRCPVCGHTTERRRPVKWRDDAVWCVRCGPQRLDHGRQPQRMRRVFTPPAVHIKHAA